MVYCGDGSFFLFDGYVYIVYLFFGIIGFLVLLLVEDGVDVDGGFVGFVVVDD